MRFRLRTLLMGLAIGPPVLWVAWLGWQEHALRVREAQRVEMWAGFRFSPVASGIRSVMALDGATPED